MAKDGTALAAGAMINTSITPLERLKATFQMDSPISRIVSVSASLYGPVWRDLDAASSANAGKGGSDGGALDSVPLFIRQFVAGGVSGGIAKSSVAPLERVKILFQTRRAEFQSVGIWGSFRKITQTEGLSGFYRGNGASVARIVPYSALHYMVYEQYREWIMYGFPDIGKGPVLDLLAGAFAGGTAVISTYPLDLVRTKLAFQVVGSSKSEQVYGGIADCFSKIYKQNGFRGLYRGVGPTMYGIFPYSGLRFFVYETLKNSFEEERKKHISVNLASGSVAGLVGQTVTYPLDVVRRQMQAHAFSTSNHVIGKGTFETLAMIIRTQGWRSLFSGLSINYVKVVPSVAIGFTVYEEMKSLLKVPSRRGEANAPVKKETSNKPSSSLDSDSDSDSE